MITYPRFFIRNLKALIVPIVSVLLIVWAVLSFFGPLHSGGHGFGDPDPYVESRVNFSGRVDSPVHLPEGASNEAADPCSLPSFESQNVTGFDKPQLVLAHEECPATEEAREELDPEGP